MNSNPVTLQRAGSIGIITLNQSYNKNAITANTVSRIKEIKDEIGYKSGINVVVITGEGNDAFSIGTDNGEYSLYPDPEVFLQNLSAASIVSSFEQPTIAAINGDAYDQGLEIALACDIRVSSESAKFAFKRIENSEIPWDGATQRLSRIVGSAKALEMILLSETVDSKEALQIGLVSYLFPEQELLSSALKMAKDISDKGPIALKYAKEAIHKGLDMTLEQGLRLEADLYFLLHTTSDRIEGITAFQEKRDPKFQGK